MGLLDRLAEAHIEAAVERGELDDLPGAGRPQKLDDDAHVPASLRAGYRLLKNAGFVPPEIQTARAIRDVEALLAAAEPHSAEAEHATRRLRWLEIRLAESRRGRALLTDNRYGDRIRQRLGQRQRS
jgi:hypothetical protein